MRDAAGVRRFAVDSGDGVGIVHHRGIHHLDRAEPSHLYVLGEIDLAHATLAELLDHVIAIGDHLADQIACRPRRTQRLSIVGTKLHVIGIFGGADGADLHAAAGAPPPPPPPPPAPPGSSTRNSLSPTMIREP